MIGNPHALAIATSGIIVGSSIGYSTEGYLVTISEYTYIPPEPSGDRRTGPGMRGFRQEEKKYKTIIVTVEAYGNKVTTAHVVEDNVKIGVEDVMVKEKKNGEIVLEIKNISKTL